MSEPRLGPSPQDPRVIYVCAAARSGSTLSDMFLGSHSQVASLGELNFLGKAISLGQSCTCGSTVGSCGSWAMVLDALKAEVGPDLRANPYGLRLWDALASTVVDHAYQTASYRRAVQFRKAWMEVRGQLPAAFRERVPIPESLRLAIQNKVHLYRIIARLWQKRVLVDSSKNQREAVELYLSWPERVRVVLLTRDGRGVYLSQKRGGRDNAQSLAGWRNYYRRALPLIERHVPAHAKLWLRYEDLASDPEAAGRQLCNFAGIPFEPSMLDLAGVTRHMVNGNDTRFAPGKGFRLDERWRRELSRADLDYFERHGGGAMNRLLGYT